MQLISAIVRPGKVAGVCDALQAFGFHGLTVTDAQGFGKQRGPVEIYRGVETAFLFQPRNRIDIVARDEDVDEIIIVICKVASTSRRGDGKIWVTPVSQLVRIHTREVGTDAL